MSTATGRIFNLQRHSTEDGPGIRTTVFLKGCPMHCPWCHNPEGINSSPELVWYSARCMGASDCVKACPQQALELTGEGVIIDRTRCDACGECTEVCPANALEILGRKHTVDEVMAVVLRDKVFYEKSRGGMTVSGGEPSVQGDFSLALMQAARREGIHVALDTCAGRIWGALWPLVEAADLILLDLKTMDKECHQQYTGIPLDLVLANARRIAEKGKSIWVRTPVVPGHTDSEENIRRVARFIRQDLPTTTRYDLLAFNNACGPKYTRLGLTWKLEGVDKVTEETMKRLAEAARGEGLPFVHWSGMTKQPDRCSGT